MGACTSALVQTTSVTIPDEDKSRTEKKPDSQVQAQAPSQSSDAPTSASQPVSKGSIRIVTAPPPPPSTPSDMWLQATFLLLLRRVVLEHPFLEPGCSAQPHPLQNWVDRCRESYQSRKYRQARDHLLRIKEGLKAEQRPILETFRRFDVDSSGHLDDEEFANLCSYLGWDEEKTEQMDLDKDGKVTAQDMEAFVGYMGGVQQFFEKRRLRITRSRRDVCDYSGISVGAHVRACFYIHGQKSSTWREAVVREVGVAQRYGGQVNPATLGVSLEFFFGANDRHHNWRAKQVVPMSWVIGVVEDASVAASLRDIGILDTEQGFWATLLPDSEMHAMRELQTNQRAALALVRKQAAESHQKAFADVQNRFKNLGYGERELQAVMGWVQDLAPIIVHVDLDDCGPFFESDEYYRNQFETKTGKGSGEDYETNNVRRGWEHDMFGGLYDEAKPFERVKYGALNIMNDYRGVKPAARYGDSYLVLKDVRLRCTFAARDSAGLNHKRLGVLDKYLHVLEEYSNDELKNLVAVAMAAIAPAKVGGLPTAGHTELKLLRGATQDPTREWVTLGFPGLAESSGRYYFEVQLREGCCAPQVGLLSSLFTASPQASSAQGVGDDENGWAVDGQHSARWHGGKTKAWETRWPGQGSSLGAQVVVGLAVDLDKREVFASTNGHWGESPEPVFGPQDIPEDLALYPAVSLKGRADFIFGPDFRYSPPKDGGFAQWPRTLGGFVKADCPEIGSSESLRVYKEVQVHGELSLKRNVQRLVANSKYREKPKTKRSYSLNVSGCGHCSGTYNRDGAHAEMPLYKSSAGGVIYWDPQATLWKMNDTEDFTKWILSAPPVQGSAGDVPRGGWEAPETWHGVMEAAALKNVMEQNGIPAKDIQQIMTALSKTDAGGGPDQVFRVLGKRSLEEEWSRIARPPCSAMEIWDMAIKDTQQRFLREAGLPTDVHVIETDHPYEAKRTNWKRTVEVRNAKALAVYFAGQSCTRDGRTKMTISAGGLRREAAGKGARIEFNPKEGGKVVGTLEENVNDGDAWRVRLDRCKADDAKDDFLPAVGDLVEAKYKNSLWYKATVADITYMVDWYSGSKKPAVYLINWADKDPQDREKPRDQVRRPRRKPAATSGVDWENVGRYAAVPQDATESCFALCAESPKSILITYIGKVSVGVEIAEFRADRSNPFMPIVLESFQGPGPAQEKGVKAGWYLDVVSSVMGKNSRKKYAELLSGLGGGVELASGEGTNDRQMDKLLDAAFSDVEAFVERLNARLRSLTDITLVFSNSSSGQKAKLQPVAHATYSGSMRVGSEVRIFNVQGKKVSPESFLKWGPAQEAGVRTDWQVDLAKTRELNPEHADKLGNELIVGNPNTLLAMGDITIVYKLANQKKSQKFQGSGPANSEKWKSPELPGNSADFEFVTDGDGAGEPEKRWGVWALVLDKALPAPSAKTIDTLAERWVQATTKAVGTPATPRVERDGWDEGRLRALCQRHNWEFEWMTEDGERRRRAHERQGFLQVSGQLSGGAEAAAAAEAALQPRALDQYRLPSKGVSDEEAAKLATFRFMTFNVEEYYHGQKRQMTVAETVFKNLHGINKILQEHSPDVICLQEHSLGKKGTFGEQDIMNALTEGMEYEFVSCPTGETQAWFSALANVVLWKPKMFTKVKSWRVELAKSKGVVPGMANEHFTPRAATCVELELNGTNKHLVVCSTHLMGGRFEDKSFVGESMFGRSVRAEQAEKIAESIKSTCGAAIPSIISGDFNVMNMGYKPGSPFRQGALDYYENKLIRDAIETAQPPSSTTTMAPEDYTFDGFYVPFQLKVHQVLDRRLGYIPAYGRTDDDASMKTTQYSGCIDWIYIRNLVSLRDERVIEVLSHGFSDHNAVGITLGLR